MTVSLVFIMLGFFIIESIYLVALSAAMLMMGLTLLAVSVEYEPNVEPYRVLSRQLLMNLKLLVEGLDLDNVKPIYLPSSISGNPPLALLPVTSDADKLNLRRKLPKNLIVRYGVGSNDIGLMIATAGSSVIEGEVIERVSDAPGIEGVLSRIMVNRLKIASSVKVVEADGGFRVHISSPILRKVFVKPFGTVYAQIVGHVCAEALDKPTIVDESVDRKSIDVTVRVLRFE